MKPSLKPTADETGSETACPRRQPWGRGCVNFSQLSRDVLSTPSLRFRPQLSNSHFAQFNENSSSSSCVIQRVIALFDD